MKICVASSWRNERQGNVVAALRDQGHEVYDFKDPMDNGDTGFKWSDIDSNWQDWSPGEFIRALHDPIAERGFSSDFDAMKWCDAILLVMPCGRSAHLELGWGAGAGKHTAVLLNGASEPELMYKMNDSILQSIDQVIKWLEDCEMQDGA